ncbi:putative glycerol-3-phosphate acyltransferase 3 [Hibiscus syriacus]|uniref:Glycerol-3-phosphate acyltransferase 3 n=1 Tax=Hibiscus syriacus TaxID=106335 RepID=A0A6A3CEE0_HIBSY|nr:putative glycerol-3-phosphate acyltransferase 3 [Hibiscus syriacus]
MLVAFEAGGLIRAFLLFVLYPFLCLASEEMGLRIMVFVCFFGIKTKSFKVGSAVLPKFFLEDVALGTLEMLEKADKKVGNLPGEKSREKKLATRSKIGVHETTHFPRWETSFHPNTVSHTHHVHVAPLQLHPFNHITAVTYSLSRVSELLAHIKTVRLTRDRDRDGEMMGKLLQQGDLVVCPEGTTCREPYLLRFSPLFAEMSDSIIPVAMDSHVGMFYGTTAGGLKCLDPLFFIMNPRPSYKVQVLAGVPGVPSGANNREASRFEVANHVQSEIGKALGFGCTRLTRIDKYLILAGNEGTVFNTFWLHWDL